MRMVHQVKGFVYFVEDDCLKTGFNYLIRYPQLIYPLVGYKGRLLGAVELSSLLYAISTLQSHATPIKMYVRGDYPVLPAGLRKEKLLEVFVREPFLWYLQENEGKGFAGLALGYKLLQDGVNEGRIEAATVKKFSELFGEEFYKILKILDAGQISFLFKKFLMIATYKAFNFKAVYPYLDLSSLEEKIIELSLKLNNGQKAELSKIAGFKRSALYQQLKGQAREGKKA